MDIVAILRGLVLNPLLVAFARGLLEAAAMAALLFAADYVTGGHLPEEYKLFGPMILLALRQIEGVADKIDPAKQRRRDALREEARFADTDLTPLEPGDVTG
jgi:hypothetical protein